MSWTPGLSPSVSHTRIDRRKWNNIYVVGDVHGCLETLQRLLKELDPASEDLVVFVGDLVRKGPDSKGVLELVRERSNLVSVRGNNEQKLIDGIECLASLTARDLSFIESLPVMISWEDSLVVHGGIDPRKDLDEHSRAELLTMRSLVPDASYERPFWFERHREPPRVFFGHTVLSEPVVSDWVVGLDTGCVHGALLTAYDVLAEELITVEPPETYLERSADSIVDPQAKTPR